MVEEEKIRRRKIRGKNRRKRKILERGGLGGKRIRRNRKRLGGKRAKKWWQRKRLGGGVLGKK